jgi:hypothetical protein
LPLAESRFNDGQIINKKQDMEKEMNKQTSFIFLLSFVFVLTACGQANSISSNGNDIPALGISTAAGLTHTASSITTISPQPTSTPTIFPTATLPPTQTLPPLEVRFPTATLSPFTETPYPSPTYIFSNVFDCDNSAYVKDVTIPDGTSVTPGTIFKKTWNLRNTGTCPWKRDYSIVFISGYSMEGETATIDKYVGPGKTANIAISLTAPNAEGTFAGYWMLADENGIRFGQLLNVLIVVSSKD